MSFGALYLGPAIADFMRAYPGLRIELTLNDRFIDPIEEGMDVTIRIAELADSSLIARKLAPARRALAAAPSYLAAFGEPCGPEDLAPDPKVSCTRLSCVIHRFRDNGGVIRHGDGCPSGDLHTAGGVFAKPHDGR
jgi:DNA-binding transcriptional LysR family regulator